MISVLIRDFTQRRVIVVFTDVSGQTVGPVFLLGLLALEDGADRLSRNVGTKVPLYAV
jgi:hypothetical protein